MLFIFSVTLVVSGVIIFLPQRLLGHRGHIHHTSIMIVLAVDSESGIGFILCVAQYIRALNDYILSYIRGVMCIKFISPVLLF